MNKPDPSKHLFEIFEEPKPIKPLITTGQILRDLLRFSPLALLIVLILFLPLFF